MPVRNGNGSGYVTRRRGNTPAGNPVAIDGRVRWVASEAAFTPYFALTERDRGRLSFVAKIDITEDRERLPDGVPVEVEFLLDGNQ